ncbi:MAG TPA: hypothetical protein VF435_07865 [Pyrinomonadaceae bacterium]
MHSPILKRALASAIELKKEDHPLPATKYDFLKLQSYIHEIGYAYGFYLEFRVGHQTGISNALLFIPDSKPESLRAQLP